MYSNDPMMMKLTKLTVQARPLPVLCKQLVFPVLCKQLVILTATVQATGDHCGQNQILCKQLVATAAVPAMDWHTTVPATTVPATAAVLATTVPASHPKQSQRHAKTLVATNNSQLGEPNHNCATRFVMLTQKLTQGCGTRICC